MVALYPIGYHGGITHTIELPVAGDNHDLPLSTPDIGGAALSNQPDVHVLRPVGFQLGLSAFSSPMTLVIQQEPPGGYTFPPKVSVGRQCAGVVVTMENGDGGCSHSLLVAPS